MITHLPYNPDIDKPISFSQRFTKVLLELDRIPSNVFGM